MYVSVLYGSVLVLIEFLTLFSNTLSISSNVRTNRSLCHRISTILTVIAMIRTVMTPALTVHLPPLQARVAAALRAGAVIDVVSREAAARAAVVARVAAARGVVIHRMVILASSVTGVTVSMVTTIPLVSKVS